MTAPLLRFSVLCVTGLMTFGCSQAPGADRPEANALAPDRADQESIEACVLESAVSGHEADCVGLWSDACVAAGRDADRCAHIESRLWVRVLLDVTPKDADLPYPEIQKAIATCERAGGPPGRCERDGTAEIVIPALLVAEGT